MCPIRPRPPAMQHRDPNLQNPSKTMLLSHFWSRLCCFGSAVAWTSTVYMVVAPSYYSPVSSTIVYTTKVSPTGPVSTTSTASTTEKSTLREDGASYVVSVTTFFLAPGGAVCNLDLLECPIKPGIAASTINTTYHVAVTIDSLPSCTGKSTFHYTTVHTLSGLTPSYDSTDVQTLRTQATDPSVAAFVTTYATTLSINLGGQPVVRTVCQLYLRDGAFVGLRPTNELPYLDRCVDPRRYLACAGSLAETGGCPTGAETGEPYPPTAPSPTFTGAGSELSAPGSFLVWITVSWCWLAVFGLPL